MSGVLDHSATHVCVRRPAWLRTDERPVWADTVAWAQTAERLGFDGIFVGDRMLAEVGTEGRIVYGSTMLDAVVTLSALASVTERVALGTLVLVLPYRHPLQVAKTFASLDVVSGGRAVLGAGMGWNAVEFEALGLDRRNRGRDFARAVSAIRSAWLSDADAAASDDPAVPGVHPGPTQPGGPPIWISSFAPDQNMSWKDGLPAPTERALARVGRIGDGWIPLVYSASAKNRITPRLLRAAYDRINESAAKAGRSERSVDLVHSDWIYVLDGRNSRRRCEEALAKFFEGSWQDAMNTYLIGTGDEVASRLMEQMDGVGEVDTFILTPLSDEVEQLELIARDIAPVLRRSAT